ncbi:Uncharacterized protein TCM_037314 [Theobroma cacao]|uniref:Transmembrane protein n=1 Tax=Theobroma cacao TaxID=3641 RepID=A0A061GL98_THECC|nr:Uncharacterized protein TCM_037314 [Theobroma cacao]
MFETMGRMIPLDGDPIIHSALPFSLLVAGMAATIAIITGLCGFRRKPSADSSAAPHLAEKSELDVPPSNNAAETTLVPPSVVTTSITLETEERTDNSEEVIKELPPPPAMRTLRETYSCNNFMTKSASSRKLSSTLSLKHKRSISVNKIREKGKSKAEESVWTKTIILGEKCRVSDDHDDAVIYDGKGNRVTTYHPRSLSTVSLSRTCSSRNPDTISNQDKEKEGA